MKQDLVSCQILNKEKANKKTQNNYCDLVEEGFSDVKKRRRLIHQEISPSQVEEEEPDNKAMEQSSKEDCDAKEKGEEKDENAFDMLPNELLSQILIHNLPSLWHVVCQSVCQRWRIVLLLNNNNKTKRSSFKTSYATTLALGGHLNVLQWARSQGWPWDEWTCANAALGGHLKLLQWLKSQGCPWNEWTCVSAAQGGNLEMVKWLRSQGCPWSRWVCAYAAQGGQHEILQWLISQGCPWDDAW